MYTGRRTKVKNLIIGFVIACILFLATGNSGGGEHELIDEAYRTGYDEGYASAGETASESMHKLNFRALAGEVFQNKCLTSVGARLDSEGFIESGEWKRFCKGVDEYLQCTFDDFEEESDKNYTYYGIDYGDYTDNGKDQ